jgi:hypothetical protein
MMRNKLHGGNRWDFISRPDFSVCLVKTYEIILRRCSPTWRSIIQAAIVDIAAVQARAGGLSWAEF